MTSSRVSDKLATKKVNATLKSLTAHVVEAMNQAVEDIQIPPIEVPVYKDGKYVTTLDGHVNPLMKKIVAVAEMGIPICLFGGSGTGKTTIAKQLAQTLNKDFYCQTVTAGMPESMLLGRQMITENQGVTTMEYVQTPFLKAVENGGVFLLDEFDAIDENCALAINNILEFGELDLPMRVENPKLRAHKDFTFIACANTKLNGASLIHNGRNQLDGATISRFDGGIFEIGYDLHLEKLLCPRPEIRLPFQNARMTIKNHDIRKEISTRTLKRAEMMWSTGLFKTVRELMEHFMVNWAQSERELIFEEMGDKGLKKLIDKELTSEEEEKFIKELEKDLSDTKEASAEFLNNLKELEVTEVE
tara:strand:+ start:3549 stop:4628 length:1080 start_codon:yes stop_codon:yes gene_type:complete